MGKGQMNLSVAVLVTVASERASSFAELAWERLEEACSEDSARCAYTVVSERAI